MSLALRQFAAMAYYETLMQWRRRPVVVLTLALIFNAIVLFLISRESLANMQPPPADSAITSTQALMFTFSMMVWPVNAVVIVFILPALMADVIPLDQTLKTGELLRSLPLTNLTYILGKLAGAWVAVSIGFGIVMILQTVAWMLAYPGIVLEQVLMMFFFGILPLIVLCGGLGILIGATQPTRRRAFGLVLIVILIAMLAGGFQADLTNPILYLSPIRIPFFAYFMSLRAVGVEQAANAASAIPSAFELKHLALTTLVGGLEMVIAAALLHFNFRYQETH
jgi:hypothetical protein